MKKVIFYHAGCPVCVNAEQNVLALLDQSQFSIDVVHLGLQPNRIPEAEKAGLKSVPALLWNDQILHINYGASLEEVKESIK